MPSWELLETRNISGRGLLIVPDIDIPYRRYALVTDVIRAPRNLSLNYNINPPESFYGRMAFRWGSRVMQFESIKYVSQVWFWEPDICGQTIIALKCATDTHNQSIVNLGVAQGLPPISVNNPLESFSVQSLQWDETLLTCFADTALRLQLWGLPYQYCSPYDVFVDPGLPESPFPPSVSPGTPLDYEDLSPAYEGENDGGLTIPYPGDSNTPPPPCSNVCQSYTVQVQINRPNGTVFTYTTVTAWGAIGGLKLKNPGATGAQTQALQLFCQGLTNFSCQPAQYWQDIRTARADEIGGGVILSIT